MVLLRMFCSDNLNTGKPAVKHNNAVHVNNNLIRRVMIIMPCIKDIDGSRLLPATEKALKSAEYVVENMSTIGGNTEARDQAKVTLLCAKAITSELRWLEK